MKLEDVKQKELLGKGAFGMVYLATDEKYNKYAIKIEKILEKDLEQSYKSIVWREIDFAQTMHKKYPNHFLKLYDWDIEKNCEHMHEYEKEEHSFDESENNYEENDYEENKKKLKESKYCFKRLYSFIDETLEHYLSKKETINKDTFYDLFVQIIYVIYLMKNEGYIHNDFHFANIGIIKTNKKYIDIFGKTIPTHGMLIQAIDYGTVLHKKYKKYLTHIEKEQVNSEFNDIITTLSGLIIFKEFAEKYKNYLKKKNIINVGFNIFTWGFDIDKKDQEFLKIYFDKLDLIEFEKEDLISICFKIIFYEKYEKEMVTITNFNPIKPSLLISENEIFYIIRNIHNIKGILLHFLKKYKEIENSDEEEIGVPSSRNITKLYLRDIIYKFDVLWKLNSDVSKELGITKNRLYTVIMDVFGLIKQLQKNVKEKINYKSKILKELDEAKNDDKKFINNEEKYKYNIINNKEKYTYTLEFVKRFIILLTMIEEEKDFEKIRASRHVGESGMVYTLSYNGNEIAEY